MEIIVQSYEKDPKFLKGYVSYFSSLDMILLTASRIGIGGLVRALSRCCSAAIINMKRRAIETASLCMILSSCNTKLIGHLSLRELILEQCGLLSFWNGVLPLLFHKYHCTFSESPESSMNRASEMIIRPLLVNMNTCYPIANPFPHLYCLASELGSSTYSISVIKPDIQTDRVYIIC